MTPTLRLAAALALLAVAPGLAHAQISVRSALSDDRDVAPGTVYEGAIIVENETDVAQQARVYPTDYLFRADGTNEYGAPGSAPRSNAPWVQFSPAVLTLPPGESLPVRYTVTVPDTVGGRAPEGSYWSLLMVEAIPPDAPASTLRPAGEEPEFGVRQVLRYGVQVATHVQGTGAGEIALSGASLVEAEAGHALALDVANTGTRMVRPAVWVELFDAEGGSRGRVDGAQNRLYPGTSVRQRIGLGALPSGTYKALVVVDPGGDDVYGAEYTFEL